ncbi:MAG: S41 family peptidase [Solirubrobacteraceae bacterium]
MSSIRRNAALVALTVVVVLGVLSLGLFLGGHPEDLPGFARGAFVASTGEAKLVDEAIATIDHAYYRPIKERKLVGASIAGMVKSLDDPYSEYLPPSAFKHFDAPTTFTGIGVSVKQVSNGLQIIHVFDKSPARRAGLEGGETIVEVDGHALAGVSLDHAVELIEGRPGSQVHLELVKQGRPEQVTLTRETIARPIVASEMKRVHTSKRGAVKLGWVYLATFSEGADEEVASAVHALLEQGAQGLVLDLRGNGGGLVSEAQRIASLFVAKGGVVVTTRGRAQPTVVLKALGGAIPSSIPMVVLVDHSTASAAEILTGALQDHGRATVVGTHTYGKGVFQELEPLGNGGGLKITVGEFFTPNGRNLGGGGVKRGAGITPEVLIAHGIDTEHGLQVALGILAGKLA